MATQNFELFIGYLGNGATVCNKAVTEHGNYKTVAHISNAGNIKLYVALDYIPAEAMQQIKATADEHRKKTLELLDLYLNYKNRATYPDGPLKECYAEGAYIKIVEEVADHLPLDKMNAFFDALKAAATQEEKNKIIIDNYLLIF